MSEEVEQPKRKPLSLKTPPNGERKRTRKTAVETATAAVAKELPKATRAAKKLTKATDEAAVATKNLQTVINTRVAEFDEDRHHAPAPMHFSRPHMSHKATRADKVNLAFMQMRHMNEQTRRINAATKRRLRQEGIEATIKRVLAKPYDMPPNPWGRRYGDR